MREELGNRGERERETERMTGKRERKREGQRQTQRLRQIKRKAKRDDEAEPRREICVAHHNKNVRKRNLAVRRTPEQKKIGCSPEPEKK